MLPCAEKSCLAKTAAHVYLSPPLSGSLQSGPSASPPPAASPWFPWLPCTGQDEPAERRRHFWAKQWRISGEEVMKNRRSLQPEAPCSPCWASDARPAPRPEPGPPRRRETAHRWVRRSRQSPACAHTHACEHTPASLSEFERTNLGLQAVSSLSQFVSLPLWLLQASSQSRYLILTGR